MRIFNNDQCKSWLDVHGFKYQNIDHPNADGFVYFAEALTRTFEIDTDAKTQLLLTYRLAQWLDSSNVLVWITSWATYHENEKEVFENFRQRYGEHRWLMQAPGHLFDTTNKEDVSLLAQTLLFMTGFNWEGFVLQGDRQSNIWMADEVIETNTQSEEKDKEVAAIIDELYIKAMGTDTESSVKHPT